MKVFVAGGSGFVGSHVCEALHAAGHKVRKGHWMTMPDFQDERFENYYGDLRRAHGSTWGCRGMDAVVMCAAVTSGAKDIVECPMIHNIDNTVMNTRMLAAAYEEGVKHFVFVSSSTVYPFSHSPLKERAARIGVPPDVYAWVGQMKRYAETQGALFAFNATPSMRFTTLRPANMYGPGDKFDPEKSHMVAAMVRRFAEKQDPLEVWGDGLATRNLMYVGDFADAVVRVVERPKERAYEEFNVAPLGTWSVREVIATLEEITGHRPEVKYDHYKPTTISQCVLDERKFKEATGWAPKVTLDEGLRRTLAWYELSIDKMRP